MASIYHFVCLRVYQNADDIEAREFFGSLVFDVGISCRNHPPFFILIYIFFRHMVSECARACLYFYKHNLFLILRNKIHLKMSHAPVVLYDTKAFLFQHLGCLRFTEDSYRVCYKTHYLNCSIRAASNRNRMNNNNVKPHSELPP